MPDEVLDEETDNDPNTQYEDTEAHERVGFRVDDSMPLNNVPLNIDPGADQIRSGFKSST